MTELEEVKAKLELLKKLFSSFCVLIEGNLGRERVLYFISMAQAQIEREMNSKDNEPYEDELS